MKEKGEWLTDYSVDENETVFFEDQMLVKAPYSSPNHVFYILTSGSPYQLLKPQTGLTGLSALKLCWVSSIYPESS